MDEDYDVVVLGTGLTECVMSSICSQQKLKVLHMDRNKYYGGESTSLTPLTQLYNHFKDEEKKAPSSMGTERDWNVDLIPKFLMAEGNLVKLLIHTGVTRYLEFKVSEGSYVLKDNKMTKLPTTPAEGMKTSLMGFMEKRRFVSFMNFVRDLDLEKPLPESVKEAKTTADLYAKYSLSPSVQSAIGHAIALQRNDAYLNEPWLDTVKRIKLYFHSIARYGKSPYLYPLYGLGELPQGFARICAVYGGTYMLDKPFDKAEKEEDGYYRITTSDGGQVRAKKIVADPSYFPKKVKKIGEVIRVICLLSHPVPNTNDAASCQIIIPNSQSNRHHDTYICVVSHAHNVCAKGHYLAIVSTTRETENSEESEVAVALNLLGTIDKKFTKTYDLYEPLESGCESNIFISKSYDATTHFETTCDDIMNIYERMMGEKFDFSKVKSTLHQDEE